LKECGKIAKISKNVVQNFLYINPFFWRNTMRKAFAITLILGLLVAMFSLPATAQEERWDGADDLDVNPLACGVADAEEEASDEEAAEEEAEGVEYDGGMVADAEDKAGADITLVDVPKLVGIGYFAATTQGQQEAAEELGNVTVTTDAPTEANIDDQIQVIDSYITQGVDGILFAANDPVAISPVLRSALEQGIHVVGYDANSEADAREWFINQAEFNGIAKSMIDSLVDQMGEDASFGIVTSTFTTPNQARWIAEMWAYAGECYPELEWLETLEAQEDAVLSFQQAQTLINKYGEDLDGIFGMTSVATPNSADAVQQADLCEDIAVVGLATPNDMKPYVNDGCVRDVVLWNPVDLGYAAVYVMRAIIDGEFVPGDTSVMAGRLGELQVVNGSEVLLGAPFIFNAENINDFDF
jgi:ABC-type sugar transport system substrate-binding protein